MKVVVTGGTGFIGRPLVSSFVAQGADVTVLTRSGTQRLPEGAHGVVWMPGDVANKRNRSSNEPDVTWYKALDGADAVVHLAGEPIAAKRWTAAQKTLIRDSRVLSTRALVEALGHTERKPRVLISCSAIGYYGPRGDEEVTEADAPGNDFLSGVCVAWEQEARRAEELGIRVVLLRNGLVLEKDGGALPKMLLPFRWFVGGPTGSGRQWMSWIHRKDLIGLIYYLIKHAGARGPVNAVAPNPVTNLSFSRSIGRVMGRPSLVPVPGPFLRLALGEMAEALLLTGQRVLPVRALESGFSYQYPDLEPALQSILGYST